MTRTLARLAAVSLGVALTLAAVAPAAAEEWKIYMVGKTEPIVADYYAEESPWIFYHDDQSMYVFAVGCNRVARVERAGQPIPMPACPVEKLPTTMPRVYIALIDLEAKRLDDSIARLREQTRAYAEAAVGSSVAARAQVAAGSGLGAEIITLQQNLGGIAFLASQINETLFDIRLTEQRVGALLDATKTYPRPERQRYFFFLR